MKTALRMLVFGLLLPSFGGLARAQAPAAGQPYQIPAGYEAYGAGTLISYGGYNYVTQGNGTMLLAADSQPSDGGATTTQGPVAGQPYQVPAGYEAYGAGTLISYGGYNYVTQGNATMLLAADSQPSQSYQQPQYTYQQPQYTYQQPQYTYQQPQYTYQQPQYTYQSQYSNQPGGYPVTTGWGGGRTLGNSNTAISVDRSGRQTYHNLNSGMSRQNSRPSGNSFFQWGNR